MQLNFRYISQRKILSDDTLLVEDDEQAAKALENIVQIKKEEMRQKDLRRQEYISNNPGKQSLPDEIYSQSFRNCFQYFVLTQLYRQGSSLF